MLDTVDKDKPSNVPAKGFGKMLANLSPLLSRISWLNRAGLQTVGNRDLYKVFGYFNDIKPEQYLQKYLRQDVAQRIINAPVGATWADPPIVTGGAGFETVWEDLVKNKFLYTHLAKLDTFAGIGPYAIMVIGTDDGQSLETPANPNRSRKLTYLQPYLALNADIDQIDERTTSNRFSQPTFYNVRPGDFQTFNGGNKAVVRPTVRVHWTRVIHVADNCLESSVMGHSRLEPVYNLLDDLLKVVGGSSECFWLTANRGLHVDVDKEMAMDEEDADNLAEELDEYESQLRRVIRTRGVKINSLGSEVADPRGNFDVIMSLVSANTGIPKRVLLGAEAGQLASQQDRANWAVRIAERVDQFAEPTVLRPTIDRFVALGIVPEPQGLDVDWPDAYKMSPLESAQTSAQMARSMANVTKALSTARKEVGETVFSIDEARKACGFGQHMPEFEGKPVGKKLTKVGEGPTDQDPATLLPTGPFGKPALPGAKPGQGTVKTPPVTGPRSKIPAPPAP